MATDHSMTTAAERREPVPTDTTSYTAGRIRAYALSMRPIRGCRFRDDIEQQIQSARVLLERLAESARDEDPPTLKPTPAQCADLLTFMQHSEPVDKASWWADRNEVSHLCGLGFVLHAMEESLRAPEVRS